MANELEPGLVLGGRYRLVRCIGRGGFGEVWYGERLATGQGVAIKVLVLEEDHGHIITQRFLREARTISLLKHPHTVRMYDVGSEPDGQLFMVLEFIEGETLQQRLRTFKDRGWTASQADVATLAIQVLRSLAEAHAAGVVHRDIKPSNLMLQAVDEDTLMVRVLDFGVAHIPESKLTRRGITVGTLGYMSPEQCLGHELDGRADLYGLGIVMYQCVTGQLPFEGKAHAVITGHIGLPPPPLRRTAKTPLSDGFIEILELALAKDPEHRFADAHAMRRALECVRDEVPPVVGMPSLLTPRVGMVEGLGEDLETANTSEDVAVGGEGGV